MIDETLEEDAERINYFVLDARTPFNNGFKEGAKWQQERSYSEEDMIRAICMKKDGVSVDSIIKQFKEK